MAAPGRRADTALETASVERSLFARGCQFEFFQAVRLLCRLQPSRESVGTTARLPDEVCRFQTHASLAFPASAVHMIDAPSRNDEAVTMTVAFMGLFGSQGVMPAWYTERIIARKAERDGVLEAFFNLFNHRFISLFYRAWEKHQAAIQYELAAVRKTEPDPFTASLYDLIGMGTTGLRGRLKIADHTLLLYGGLIAQRPHSAAALRCILRDYFGVAVGIDQFVGSWYEFEDTDRAWLSDGLERNQLGVGAFIGRRVWDQQARIRIRLGPLPIERFRDFLPDGAAMRKLRELTRFLIGPALAFDVQPVLRAGDVPRCGLSLAAGNAGQLGRMAWLKTCAFRRDADDAVFAYVR